MRALYATDFSATWNCAGDLQPLLWSDRTPLDRQVFELKGNKDIKTGICRKAAERRPGDGKTFTGRCSTSEAVPPPINTSAAENSRPRRHQDHRSAANKSM